MIPKKIHYCWFGGTALPSSVKRCKRTWEKYCPDYEIIEWNESNFDINCHPFVKSAYEVKAWAFVSDYARLKIIYENGGIYLDTDVELLKNLDFLLDNPCYVGIQQGGFLCNTGLGFGAAKSHSVIREMIEKYDDVLFEEKKKLELACPRLNSLVLEKMGYHYTDQPVKLDGTLILPCRYMDPLAPGDKKNLLCEDTVSIHHYSATWMSGNIRRRRKLIAFIGEEKIHRLKKLLGRAR